MLNEVGVLGEVVVAPVLKHENATVFQQRMLEHEVGNLRQLLQRVWGIGKDEVELLVTALQETEHVATKGDTGGGAELLQTVADETVMVAVQLHTDDLIATARHELERDAARAAKEVERRGSIEIDIAAQHIEDVLLGKIGRRTRLERARYLEMPSLILSCDNSHYVSLFKKECLLVVGHALWLGAEVLRRVDDMNMLQEAAQLREHLLALLHIGGRVVLEEVAH